MKFTVVWRPVAEARLAEIWEQSANRRSVSDAANQLERQLQQRGGTVGESRTANTRVVFESPSGLLFEVHAEDQLVTVLSVWQFD